MMLPRIPSGHSHGLLYWTLFLALIWAIQGCSGSDASVANKKNSLQVNRAIRSALDQLDLPEGVLNDSVRLRSPELTMDFYRSRKYEPVWSIEDSILPVASDMIDCIGQARTYGCFPSFYHLQKLQNLQGSIRADTASKNIRKNASEWAQMDLMLTDAFLTLARHVHRGHAPTDSLPDYRPDTYLMSLQEAIDRQDPRIAIDSLQPRTRGYLNLIRALPDFLRKADFQKEYTYVAFPFRDSLVFITTLIQRLKEEKYLPDSTVRIDAEKLSFVLKKFQADHKMTTDGKFGSQMAIALSNNDPEKFMKAAINLDRHRTQTDTLPERYIWVNLPAFLLEVIDQDTVRLESRVIVGKPKTRTPTLKSRISDIIVYPTWTIPASIITAEILPAMKRDPGYLAKKGYNLYDYSGNEIDPRSVDWSRYKKGIPYKIVQGEGIGNALGIMKFNFPNAYDVYLHDTNQRGLFNNENRSLSHGCVRVQKWEELYQYILRTDSLQAIESDRKSIPTDSIRHWLKEKHKKRIPIRAQIAVFFRYYTAVGKNGKLETYHDLYGEDASIRDWIEGSKK